MMRVSTTLTTPLDDLSLLPTVAQGGLEIGITILHRPIDQPSLPRVALFDNLV